MPLVEDADRLAAAPDPVTGLASAADDEKARPYTQAKGTASPIAIPAPSPLSVACSAPCYARRMSEESIRTELCEGLLLDGSPVPAPAAAGPSSTEGTPPLERQLQQQQPLPPPDWPVPSTMAVTDRAELIERLKRGESPTWVPNRRLESMIRMRSCSPTPSRPASAAASSTSSGATLLPAADICSERAQPGHDVDADAAAARLRDGLHLERPRSALHRGDFTASADRDATANAAAAAAAAAASATTVSSTTASPPSSISQGRTAAWLATSPPRDFVPFSPASDRRSLPSRSSSLAELGIFSSPSSSSASLSNSFVYKPPTSPLVQSQSQTDDDDDDDDDDDGTMSFLMSDLDGDEAVPQRRTNQRRHTLASTAAHHPHTFGGSSGLSFFPHSARPPPPPTARRDSLFPYQAHQPRRSLSSTSSHNPFRSVSMVAATATATPARARRMSVSSDTSPLQHASMVGSYEESILRGRMSTTPSKPLDFLAQIGVLGLGPQCPASLRCPPHVTIPFAAVFYSYHQAAAAAPAAHARSKTDDSPSPYVGTIDLENGLPNPDAEQRSRRKAVLSSRRAAARTGEETATPRSDVVMEDAGATNADTRVDSHSDGPPVRLRRRRISSTPKAPPGGSYRIPEKGQLQIIIKNQNKTAVKLFLVPYDLTGMEPGTKTFIRQRSYSAPTTDASSTTTTTTATATTAADRPVLRYLVHLHICCPARGRHYLYRSIRVVFANRVPDDKETLRNEATFPDPRYSPYKPVRVNPPPPPLADPALRRRSANLLFAVSSVSVSSSSFPARDAGDEEEDDGSSSAALAATSSSFDAFGRRQHSVPPPVPLSFPPLPAPMLGSGSSGGSVPVDPIPRHRVVHMAQPPSPSSLSSASQQTSRPCSGHAGAGGGCDLNAGVDDDDGDDDATANRSPWLRARDRDGVDPYRKLRRGDAGYGGNALAAAAEGLLSQRLRSLDVQTGQLADETSAG